MAENHADELTEHRLKQENLLGVHYNFLVNVLYFLFCILKIWHLGVVRVYKCHFQGDLVLMQLEIRHRTSRTDGISAQNKIFFILTFFPFKLCFTQKICKLWNQITINQLEHFVINKKVISHVKQWNSTIHRQTLGFFTALSGSNSVFSGSRTSENKSSWESCSIEIGVEPLLLLADAESRQA